MGSSTVGGIYHTFISFRFYLVLALFYFFIFIFSLFNYSFSEASYGRLGHNSNGIESIDTLEGKCYIFIIYPKVCFFLFVRLFNVYNRRECF